MDRTSSPASDPIVVVTACDENYAHGAAAAVRSAIDSVGPTRSLRVFVLDGGITEPTKDRQLRSWRSRNVSVTWLRPDLDAIRDMPVSDHINLSTYLRILMAELLPADVSKAIYLDADTLVLRNLAELWSVPLDDYYCAATQDAFVPVLDPLMAFDHPIHCVTLTMTSPYPIPNFRELGLVGDAPYFNAGIMLVNVARWRRDEVARRGFECLRINGDNVRYWDQYALNTLFSGQWKIVDPRWNQNSHVFRIPSWDLSHYTEDEFQRVKQDPWIVHFDYKPKPWELESTHPFRRHFFQALDRTAWRGWRPRRSFQERTEVIAKIPGNLFRSYRRWRQTHWSPLIRTWKYRILGRKKAA